MNITAYAAPGSSGIGELVANTLAVRNVTVVVLDVKPIITENCESIHLDTDGNLTCLSFRQHHLLQVRCLEMGGSRTCC